VHAGGTRALTIDVDAASPLRPYALLEDILHAATGDVALALRAERAALGLATTQIRPALTANERARVDEASALRLATIPNVTVLHNPVADAWVRSLRRVGDLTVRLRRLHPTAAPSASLAVLDAWASQGTDERLALDGDDLDGDDLLAHVALGEPACRAPLSVDVRGVSPDPDATRAAFGAYAWDAALRGAVACLACDPSDPDLAMLAGLSAHYLAPHDARVSSWTAKHFALVRTRTTSAAMRSHACYRLAVHAAKHGGDAREPAEASREAARAVPAHEGRGYHLAWAHNVMALVAWRAGDGSGAVAEVERALAGLAELDEGFAPSAVEQTASHLAANLLRARSLR
jgi:hypothetical protein